MWYRDTDLRVADHAPLTRAIEDGEVIPLFVLDPFLFSPDHASERAHRVQFCIDSLRDLAQAIAKRGSQLLLAHGHPSEVVAEMCTKWGADRVLSYTASDPAARSTEEKLKRKLGAKFESCEGASLLPPGTLRTGGAKPYSVFTPFSRAFRRTARISTPLSAPITIPALPQDIELPVVKVPSCNQLGIAHNLDLLEGGERAAHARLARFLRDAARDYPDGRDRMDLAGTSRISADLRHGTISARQVWMAVQDALAPSEAADRFQTQLIWREFNASTLWDRPELLDEPFRHDFGGFPWKTDDAGWQAWVLGKTGFPVVDASARQLLAEGFVHNRARMISASFLCKHLLIDYGLGEEHYMRHLVDADQAQNNAGWQWSAGCGCDAQPYFRVFNPILQGKKFDPGGDYVRRWVPELSAVPAKYIHSPWDAPAAVLAAAELELGEDYPLPIVEHRFARARFLEVARNHLNTAPGRATRTRALDGIR